MKTLPSAKKLHDEEALLLWRKMGAIGVASCAPPVILIADMSDWTSIAGALLYPQTPWFDCYIQRNIAQQAKFRQAFLKDPYLRAFSQPWGNMHFTGPRL